MVLRWSSGRAGAWPYARVVEEPASSALGCFLSRSLAVFELLNVRPSPSNLGFWDSITLKAALVLSDVEAPYLINEDF